MARAKASIGLDALLNKVHDDSIDECDGRGSKTVFETNTFNIVKPSEYMEEVFSLGLSALADRKWRNRGTKCDGDDEPAQPDMFAFAGIQVEFKYLRVPSATDPTGYLKVDRDVASFDDWDQQLQIKVIKNEQSAGRLKNEQAAYAAGLARAGGNRSAWMMDYADGVWRSPPPSSPLHTHI
jgi:hypothetical protein